MLSKSSAASSKGVEDRSEQHFQLLNDKISTKTVVVAVCGLGYVGLPLAGAMSRSGYRVIGIDVDPRKVEKLSSGQSYIRHISSDAVNAMVQSGKFRATTDFAKIKEADVIVICVPTPLTKYREPDLSYVESTAREIAANARPGQLIILESTTYPGTTLEVLVPIFAARGLDPAYDIFLAFSPEREDPGNPEYETTTIPKVVGGHGTYALDLAAAFYGNFLKRVVRVSSPSVAEAVKLTENIFRAVNIALVNELKIIYSAMGIDIWEVIDAAKTKPFGYMAFYPGPGLGGHCIPIDPFYLTWKAREYKISTRFIELAGQINLYMPQYVVERLVDELDARFRKGVNGARVLVVGLAYKKNVDDMRESPSLDLMERLERRGAKVDYYDPYIAEIPETREHAQFAGRTCVKFDQPALTSYDVALVATDHDEVNYKMLAECCKLIIDTRNVCARHDVIGDNIIKS